MNTHVALLRGINVGGNKKVEMKKLKQVFISMGFTNVSTYINSGNVLFNAEQITKDLASYLESNLKIEFGFDIPCVVVSKESLHKIAQSIPSEWENNEEQKTDVLFLWKDFDSKDSLNLIKTNSECDKLLYVPGAIVWNVDRNLYSKSGMDKFIATLVYKNMTARNVNTVRKLDDLMNV